MNGLFIKSSFALSALLFAVSTGNSFAATALRTDVTTALGPDFFFDAAATGWSDYTIDEPDTADFDRNFGSLKVGSSGTEVTVTGIGWATSVSASDNDAETVTVTITYLGQDGAIGGGDDVQLGSETASWSHTGSGEYALDFDADMVAILDGLSSMFRISFSPANQSGSGSLRFKTTDGGASGTKLSVAGSSALQGTTPVNNEARTSGFWDQINWSTGSGTQTGDLGDGDTVIIGGYRTVTYRNQPASETVATVSLGTADTDSGQGVLVIDSGSLRISGNITVGQGVSRNDGFVEVKGGSLQVGGSGHFGRYAEACDGSLILAGGNASFGGSLNMGGFEQGGAMLRLHNPGSSTLQVTGTLNLYRCALDLTFDSNYTHTPGAVITVATYGSRNGQFLNFRDGQSFNSGVNHFRINYDVNGNSITLTALTNWTSPTSPPNVILIFADDQGYSDLSLHGDNRYPTPKIDSIASNGVRFTDAYVSGGVCHPSRVGLMLGRYQQRFGTDNNLGGPAYNGMAVSERTVARRMQGLGYRTYGVGKWHLGKTVEYHPNLRGFDRWYGMWGGSRTFYDAGTSEDQVFQDQMIPDFSSEGPLYLTDRIGDNAVKFIDEHVKNAPAGQPMFMYVSFTAVHAPMDIKSSDARFARLQNEFGLTAANYSNPPITFGVSSSTVSANRYELAAMTLALDENVGKVLDKLHAEGMLNNTLVVYTNDNGGAGYNQTWGGNYSYNTPLRGYKGGSMQEGSIRVPCVAQWPGVIPPSQVVSTPISTLDWGATFVNAAGDSPAAARNGLDGLDLMPLMRFGTALHPDRTICWRAGGTQDGGSSIRQGDWKMRITDSSGTASLYNLRDDIGENNDKASEQPEILADLLERFRSWEAMTQAPLYGSNDTVSDNGFQRWAFAGGLRVKTGSNSAVWHSSSLRDPLSLTHDFDYTFFINATESGPYDADAELWQALGDSSSRSGFIRFGIDFGNSTLAISEGKNGNSATAILTSLPNKPTLAIMRFRAASNRLSIEVDGTVVQLELTANYGALTTHAFGVAAMEGELTVLRPIEGGNLGTEFTATYDLGGSNYSMTIDFGSEPTRTPVVERSIDVSNFNADPSSLVESLGGGLYKVSIPKLVPPSDKEFFRFHFNRN